MGGLEAWWWGFSDLAGSDGQDSGGGSTQLQPVPECLWVGTGEIESSLAGLPQSFRTRHPTYLSILRKIAHNLLPQPAPVGIFQRLGQVPVV